MNRARALPLILIGLAVSQQAFAARYQCRSDSAGIRNVLVEGQTMTVVNPKTPNIVFKKPSQVETRGSITRTSNEAWDLYVKDGVGKLTNITFADAYTCIQTGE